LGVAQPNVYLPLSIRKAEYFILPKVRGVYTKIEADSPHELFFSVNHSALSVFSVVK
jgi:hypothetical protein